MVPQAYLPGVIAVRAPACASATWRLRRTLHGQVGSTPRALQTA